MEKIAKKLIVAVSFSLLFTACANNKQSSKGVSEPKIRYDYPISAEETRDNDYGKVLGNRLRFDIVADTPPKK